MTTHLLEVQRDPVMSLRILKAIYRPMLIPVIRNSTENRVRVMKR